MGGNHESNVFVRLIIKNIFICILIVACETRDPAWYQALVSHLSEDQRKDLQEVVKLAEQRKEAAGTVSISPCVLIWLFL